jgi:hypothetical protein
VTEHIHSSYATAGKVGVSHQPPFRSGLRGARAWQRRVSPGTGRRHASMVATVGARVVSLGQYLRLQLLQYDQARPSSWGVSNRSSPRSHPEAIVLPGPTG